MKGIEQQPRAMEQGYGWLPIDSLNGRYSFGARDEVADGLIVPGQSANIETEVHVPFKGERLFVHRSCASDFLIRVVIVGNRLAAKVTMDPLIAEPFAVDYDALAAAKWSSDRLPVRITVDRPARDLLGAPFPMPTLQPGMALSLSVEHIGDQPKRFLGAFLGKALW